jgi:CarD family transcriptional regulator
MSSRTLRTGSARISTNGRSAAPSSSSSAKPAGKRVAKPRPEVEAPPVVPPKPAPPASASVPPPGIPRPAVRPGPPGSIIPPMPHAPAPSFKVGDKAVHPAHGVGEVTAIEEREIGGTRAMFYILRILDNAMKVMVPVSAATQVGLRGIMSDKEANDILSTMRAREVAVDVQPWSRRFRVYTEMIKSGSPTEIAKVLRDMNRLKGDKDLSFGERRLLDQARSLLLKELAFAKNKTEADMAEEIRKIFSA